MPRRSRPRPTPPTARCHLTVANLRTMPHRSHEWPATLAQLRLAFARRGAFRGPRAGPAGVRRRGRGQPHAAGAGARRAGRRGVRLWRDRRRLPRAPASRGVEGDRPAPPARSRADPVRRSSRRRRSPPARSTTTSSRSPTSRVLFAHEKAFADRDALIDRLRAAGARLRAGRGAPTPKCRWPTRSAPICSTPSWSPRPTAR